MTIKPPKGPWEWVAIHFEDGIYAKRENLTQEARERLLRMNGRDWASWTGCHGKYMKGIRVLHRLGMVEVRRQLQWDNRWFYQSRLNRFGRWMARQLEAARRAS